MSQHEPQPRPEPIQLSVGTSSAGWTWPPLRPSAGLPVVAGEAASVGPPISVGALYLWLAAYWLVLAVLGAFLLVRLVLLLAVIVGLLLGQHPSPPSLL